MAEPLALCPLPASAPTCLSQGAEPAPSSSHTAWPAWAPGTWEGSLQGQGEKRASSFENRFLSKLWAWEFGWNRVKPSLLALRRPKGGVSEAQRLHTQPLHSYFRYRGER